MSSEISQGMHYKTDLTASSISGHLLEAPRKNREVIVNLVDGLRDTVREFYAERPYWDNWDHRTAVGFLGAYIIGSFVSDGEDSPHEHGRGAPDIDLLVVDRMGFTNGATYNLGVRDSTWIANHPAAAIAGRLEDAGFGLEIPEELPSEYNVGDVDAKWLMRATHTADDVLPIDINFVNLNYVRMDQEPGHGLETWLTNYVVDSEGRQLNRIPLVEVEILT